jgi:hypothetical protein
MDPETFIDPNLTRADLIVLNDLLYDVDATKKKKLSKQSKNGAVAGHREKTNIEAEDEDDETVQKLDAMNDPAAPEFEPTVFSSYDLKDLQQHPRIYRYLLLPYINFARKIVRVETDVVILTHLIIYCCTSIPSALLLYRHFTIAHGITHWLLQGYYTGTYTLLMHQHIHMGGVLSKRSVVIRLFDELFPYVLNPLMGHTWNSYYYHHTKHHHVEANGPDDLSSTIRYQRDSLVDFLQYVGRFLFLIWFDLPLYFIRKGKPWLGVKTGFWELGNYAAIVALLLWADRNATIFVFILPLLQLRLGLMVGNWGQHALVDDVDPKSDMRSSITLIDVPVRFLCLIGHEVSRVYH